MFWVGWSIVIAQPIVWLVIAVLLLHESWGGVGGGVVTCMCMFLDLVEFERTKILPAPNPSHRDAAPKPIEEKFTLTL